MFVGSLAEWFSGFVSLVALVGAWKAYKISYELMKNDNNRLASEIERQRRKYAEQVYATYVLKEDEQKEKEFSVLLVNKSNGVIRDVIINVSHKDHNIALKKIKAVYLVPGEYIFKHGFSREGNYWGFAKYIGPLELQKEYKPIGNTTTYMVKSLEFTDAAGIRWQVDETGKLSELEDQPR